MSKSELIVEAFNRLKTDFTGIKGVQKPNASLWIVTIFVVFTIVLRIGQLIMGTLVLRDILETVIIVVGILIVFVHVLYKYYKEAENVKRR